MEINVMGMFEYICSRWAFIQMDQTAKNTKGDTRQYTKLADVPTAISSSTYMLLWAYK